METINREELVTRVQAQKLPTSSMEKQQPTSARPPKETNEEENKINDEPTKQPETTQNVGSDLCGSKGSLGLIRTFHPGFLKGVLNL